MRKLSPNPEFLDLIFAKMEDDSLQLTTSQQIRFERLSDAYTHWLSNPMLPDNRIRDYIMARHSVTSRVANKEQMRHKANHLFDMATAAALAGDDKKAKALTKIAEGIVKNNRLEESDGEDFPWEDIIPKDISLSVDPSVIGIEPVPNIHEKAAKLLKQYTDDIDGPTQIDIPDGD